MLQKLVDFLMSQQIGLALSYLRGQGFHPVFSPKGERHFEGELQTKLGAIKIRLMIRDWDFVQYPTIVVVERPAFVPIISPHLFGTNGLCYFTPGSVILDRYRPHFALAQCLAQAQVVLDKLVSDEDYRQQEFQREFQATWSLGQEPAPLSLLAGKIGDADLSASLYFLDGHTRGLVTCEHTEAESLCRVKGWPRPIALTQCWILRTTKLPPLLSEGLPSNISDIFAWLRSWDPEMYRHMQFILAGKTYLTSGLAVFLVTTELGKIGFSFELDAHRREGFKKKPELYRQFLHKHEKEIAITRIAISDISSDFVHSRNLRFANLKDRRVVLIGCGAIGGYLAQSLAKLGAGSGTQGKLILVDPETLLAENLGRHYLGFDHLFSNKAEAIQSVLHAQFPSLNIEAMPRKVDFGRDLVGDLIINTTGDQALSEALNYYHNQLPDQRKPPMLHAWVYGNGECVQSLWVDGNKHACYRCLKLNNPERTPRFEISNNKVETRVIGCNAFTPYTVGVSLNAAGLAADHVASWLNGNASPRYRTRFTENHNVRVVKSQDVLPLKDCPACSNTHSD